MKPLKILFLIFLLSCGSNELTPKQKKAELFYSQGTTKLIKKDYTAALDYLLKANQLGPNNTKVHNNLGMTFYFKKQYAQAEYHLKKAIELNEQNSDAANNLASIYYNQKKYQAAQKVYNDILRNLVYAHQYRTHYNIALLKLKFKDRGGAYKHLLQAIKIKDDYCPGHVLLGQLERSSKNLNKALKHFNDATQGTCFNIPESHYLKAITLIDMGAFEEAQETLETLKVKFYTSPYSKLAEKRMREIATKSIPTRKSWKNLLPSQKRLLRQLENDSEFGKAYEASKF